MTQEETEALLQQYAVVANNQTDVITGLIGAVEAISLRLESAEVDIAQLERALLERKGDDS